MVTKEELKEKIEEQLAKWKPAIDGLKTKMENAEVDAKAKLHEQLESLHDKRIKAEKILQDISSASQDVWEQVKSGTEQAWVEVTRTAKSTMGKVREAISHPARDEEIRQIAYHLWRDEGCPDGRHEEHWLKAEALWRARQEAQPESARPAGEPVTAPRAKVKRPRKTAAPANVTTRARKAKRTVTKKKSPIQELDP